MRFTANVLLGFISTNVLAHYINRAKIGSRWDYGKAQIGSEELASDVESKFVPQQWAQTSIMTVEIPVSDTITDSTASLIAKHRHHHAAETGTAAGSTNDLVASGSVAPNPKAQNADDLDIVLVDAFSDGSPRGLALKAQLEQNSAGGRNKNQEVGPAVSFGRFDVTKRQTLTTASIPTPGPGLEDSRYNKIPEPDETGWIFGAIMISLTVVAALILLLYKKRQENMEKAKEAKDPHEMREWEDAYGT